MNGDISPNQPEAIRELCDMLGNVAKKYVYQWSTTQSLNITAQLQAGIRYMDLRISSKKNSEEYFCVHGLYGSKIENILQDVNNFLEAHPKEIVLLDFNHFYEMTEFNHKQLMSQILEVLGYKMCPFLDAGSISLNTMWENNLQIIVFYHHLSAQSNMQFWSGDMVPSPWPNTMKPTTLIKYLDECYSTVRPKCKSFFVYQGILTPTANFIISHLNKSLRTLLASIVCKPYTQWIQSKKAGKNGINICIMDFVEWAGYIDQVLKLNQNLAAELQ